MVNPIRHRSEEEIVADILAVILNGAKKTRIMYGANLSFALMSKYLIKLQGCGLIQYDEANKKYLLTGNGRRYLAEYAEYKTIAEKLISHNSLFEEKKGLLIQMLGLDESKGQ